MLKVGVATPGKVSNVSVAKPQASVRAELKPQSRPTASVSKPTPTAPLSANVLPTKPSISQPWGVGEFGDTIRPIRNSGSQLTTDNLPLQGNNTSFGNTSQNWLHGLPAVLPPPFAAPDDVRMNAAEKVPQTLLDYVNSYNNSLRPLVPRHNHINELPLMSKSRFPRFNQLEELPFYLSE